MFGHRKLTGKLTQFSGEDNEFAAILWPTSATTQSQLGMYVSMICMLFVSIFVCM